MSVHDRAPVVLLHGLARGPWSMALLGRRLRRAGFEVHNLSYPARPRSLAEALSAIEQQLAARNLGDSQRLDWTGYSLGCLLARAYVTNFREGTGDRLVLLAPPNHGSEIVDRIGHLRLFRWIFGELAAQLGTQGEGLPARLAVPRTEIGVIAGSRWINPLGGWLLGEQHDGSVTVDSTRLPGMADHLVLPHTHSFLMNSPRVALETEHFLLHGRFRRSSEAA